MVVSSILSKCFKGLWLAALIKSQPVPEINEGPVKIAVTKNFKAVVLDSGRDAFILFYSPECQHCKRFLPVWDQLGRKLKNEDVDVVKIDATANECPSSDYFLTAFPTIYWKFAEKSKKPVEYEGGRALHKLISYVAKTASKELNGWDRQGRPKRKKLNK